MRQGLWRIAGLIGALVLAVSVGPAGAKPLSSMNDMMERGTIAPMLEKVIPGVVAIRVRGYEAVQQNPLFGHPIFGKLVSAEMTGPAKREFTSSGSGVIVDAERGLILTNFHVIENAKEIKIRLTDGRQINAKLLGQDPATDVAALQIDAKNITAVPLGDSDEVRVGDFAVAIGNPLGLDFTATMGMVSALARSTVGYRDFESFIQHDAAVNSGNSGGALINMRGELIGINTAIRSPSGGNVGLGFAIPANMAWYVMEQLVKYGKVRRGISGLKLEDVTPEDVARLDLPVTRGAIVKGVQKGTPAEEQGFEVGDVITGVNQYEIRRAADYRALEAVAEVGHKGTVHYYRHGKLNYQALWIADVPPEQEKLTIPEDAVRMSGVVIGTLTTANAQFGEVKGVEVVEVPKNGIAFLVGLLPGDIITAVDDDRVRQPQEALQIIKSKNAKFDLKVVRKGVPVVVRFPI